MIGSLWLSHILCLVGGFMCGVLFHWARPHRPDDGPIFARSVYDAMPPIQTHDCELPISTPCNQVLLKLAAAHPPPQRFFDEKDDPFVAEVDCPSCGGLHRSDESCGCGK